MFGLIVTGSYATYQDAVPDPWDLHMRDTNMKIKNMGVGTRLGGGFSLVILLMVAMVVLGVIHLRGMTADNGRSELISI